MVSCMWSSFIEKKKRFYQYLNSFRAPDLRYHRSPKILVGQLDIMRIGYVLFTSRAVVQRCWETADACEFHTPQRISVLRKPSRPRTRDTDETFFWAPRQIQGFQAPFTYAACSATI